MTPLGITCSDLHCSHSPPLFRSNEPDWYAAMERQFDQLERLANGLPIFCAGDVFHKWNSPVELVNFLLDVMPNIYALPGQHDLANHRIADIDKTAYGTLVKAGLITNLEFYESGYTIGEIGVWAFPWGSEIVPCPHPKSDYKVRLAVIHKYIWKKGYGYQGASDEQRVGKYRENLKGYDASVWGDNHKGFNLSWMEQGQRHNLMNCGTFFRRNVDEVNYRPQVGILYDDGHIEPHYLDTTQDVGLPIEDLGLVNSDIVEAESITAKFLDEFLALDSNTLDFGLAIRRFLETHQVSEAVCKLVLESIEA